MSGAEVQRKATVFGFSVLFALLFWAGWPYGTDRPDGDRAPFALTRNGVDDRVFIDSVPVVHHYDSAQAERAWVRDTLWALRIRAGRQHSSAFRESEWRDAPGYYVVLSEARAHFQGIGRPAHVSASGDTTYLLTMKASFGSDPAFAFYDSLPPDTLHLVHVPSTHWNAGRVVRLKDNP